MRWTPMAIGCALLAGWHAASAESPPMTDTMRKELLKKADDWEVPQPSEKARLVKVWAFSSGGDRFALGFVEPGQPLSAMVGLESKDLSNGWKTKEATLPLDLSDVTCSSPFGESQGTNFGLVTGIQLLRRGEEESGHALIVKSLKDDAGHSRSPFRIPAGESAVMTLARSCLADVINDCTSGKPDFPHLLRRMVRLLADQPELKSEATDWTVDALKATAAHPPAKPGSIEALIDAYLMSGGVHGAGALRLGDEMPPAERDLVLKGFDAVPSILAQLESKRLTNHLMQGFNNFTSFPMQADGVLQAYLQRLANDEFGSNWLERQKGITPGKKAVEVWWERARATGERDYVAENLLRSDETARGEKGALKVSLELLLIASDRYPDCLPGVYKKLLASPTGSHDVASAIAASKAIRDEEKSELFAAAVSGGRDRHRNAALSHLLELDRAKNEALLIQLLDRCPKTSKDQYWRDQDAALSRFVSKSVNPAVWEALHRTLGRVDLGMKMELIDRLSPARDAPPEILVSHFKIYDRFATDDTLRKNSASKKFDGPGAAFTHDSIRMKDFIHLDFSLWLELAVEPPESGSTAKDWDAYRAKVKPEIEKARPR